MSKIYQYQPRIEFKPKGLSDISDLQIDDHWKLYEGYVKQVNALNAELAFLRSEKKTNSLAYADRRRRYGFEYNGMVLHEFYFGNLTADSTTLRQSALRTNIEATWGSVEAWREDFALCGLTRGVGWAILYLDPVTKDLTNHFIREHHEGHISTFVPILAMDVWEHAYMVDHHADGRATYIEAFLKNINWEINEKRYDDACAGKQIFRFEV